MDKTFTQEKLKTTGKKNENAGNKKMSLPEPGKHIINNILNYSKALSVTKSSNLEHIEVVLN